VRPDGVRGFATLDSAPQPAAERRLTVAPPEGRSAVLDKLDARSRVEAALIGYKAGLGRDW
jgi:hypothetical protein